MKSKFYLKIIVAIVLTFEAVSFSHLSQVQEDVLFSYDNSNYVLLEREVVDKSFINYLYKDNLNNYKVEYYDYETNEKISLNDLIKEDEIDNFNIKIEKLLYLKYPKFIVTSLIKKNVIKSILFRENELVIYFSEYVIEPEIDETLFLKVNYNEIKEYLNFTFVLDNNYKNESGYDYDKDKKSIALTFDDSPNQFKTTKILNFLKDNHFHATFFVVGEKCINNEDLLISIKNSGNEIGSHTYSHQNISKLDEDMLKDDYYKMNDIYKRLFQTDLKLFRPPYGIYKKEQLNVLDVNFILWSLDTNDWRYKNSDYLVNYVIDNVKDGDIILFHDSYNSTVNAIEKLLPILYSLDYQVMSVSELSKIKGINIENGKVYNNFN